MSGAPAPTPAAPDRRRPAALVLALSVLPWFPVVFRQLGEAQFPLAIWNLVVVGLTLAAAGVSLAGPEWTLRGVVNLSWFAAVWAGIQALRGDSILLWVACAGGGAGALLLSRPSPPPAPPRDAPAAAPPEETVGTWIKENAEAIVVAFVMALVIRCFCIEVFKIPSSSMEPTLLGDVGDRHSRDGCTFRDYHGHPSGDRIMVTKYYYAFAPVERFNVIVFKFPLNQSKNFIKRVVGLPDEEIKIWNGDLYVRPKGADVFSIVRKPLRTQESLWIDPLRNGAALLTSESAFTAAFQPRPVQGDRQAEFRVRDGRLETRERSGERGIRFLLQGEVTDGYSTPVNDRRLSAELELTSPRGEIFLEVANEHGRFELTLNAAGESLLRRFAPGSTSSVPLNQDALAGWTLKPFQASKVELWVVDGMAYARVDGRIRAKLEFIRTREELKEVPDAPQATAFGSRGGTFSARAVSVGRDVHYRDRSSSDFGMREDVAVRIPSGEYLMMGDNVNNSHDSRAWTERTYRLKDGRTVVCEAQEANEGWNYRKELQEKLGLSEEPDIAVAADLYGNEHALFRKDLLANANGPSDYAAREFRTVPGKFIVGKALWIWFPKGRWFRLIR